MLTVTIFATIVAEMLPVSNNTPLIGQLLIKSFILHIFLNVNPHSMFISMN